MDSVYCVSVKGQLLAIGGVHFDFDNMTPIRKYNSVHNSWDMVSHMTIGRCQCLAAVLSDDQLIIVGGHIDGGAMKLMKWKLLLSARTYNVHFK